MKNIINSFLLMCGMLSGSHTLAGVEETEIFNRFVETMTSQHQFDGAKIKQLFKSVDIKQNIIKAMQRPAEGMPWYKYRKIFMQNARIKSGVKFWQENDKALTEVEAEYGVPAEIIVAVIGVETLYGANTGHHRVIDALATLGFTYPKRSRFFLSELENFLLLCQEEKMDPLQPTGSYAGAMGIPQFMPSSYRAYAADFEEDGKRDIWTNPADAIASVANYFVKHHWRKGDAITFPVIAQGESFQQGLSKGLKPDKSWAELQSLSISSEDNIDAKETVKLLEYKQEKNNDLWVGLHNFYVITRYNHSPLYAMAVYQLSEAVYKQKQLLLTENKPTKKAETAETAK
ncbi:MAG: lytic murein transglycosylase B [Methylococcales symbiont of Iophon sp. n. MRB-2018]|nr:MAG: lytic murein transglycosylase B [Methylococcales symbiont of Iophon sp. n. MRB-2018]KAF3979410.1 MAG: lytic murein transglycosylase B [Methylococcales symbiont of Iophon sp. n. MRB-2018]